MMEINTEPTLIFDPLEKSELHSHKVTDESGISDETMFTLTWVLFGVICQVTDIFGIVTNIINIICFIKQDFKDSVNISLLGLAVSDLGALITLSGVNVMYSLSMFAADLPFEPIEVCYFVFTMPHISLTRVSSWITAVITIERCLCIIAPLKVKSIVSQKKMIIIITAVFIILQCTIIPTYTSSRLEMTFSSVRNKTLLGRVFVTGHESDESLSYVINNFIVPVAAFVVIVICTVILVCGLQNQTKWRKRSTAPAQSDRIFIRNQKVAKMVVMISTLFIVCFAPFCILITAAAFEPELSFGGRYIKFAIILGGLGFVLESVNSSMNIFIYYHMSSKYREALRTIFNVPERQK